MSKSLVNSLALLKEIKAQLTTDHDVVPTQDTRPYGSIKRSNHNQSGAKKVEEDMNSLMSKIDNIFEDAH